MSNEISSSAPTELSRSHLRARRKAFNSLCKTYRFHLYDRGGPRVDMLSRACIHALLVMLATQVILMCLGRAHDGYVPLLPVVGAIVVMPPAILSYFFWKGPKSWAEVLDTQLAHYEPVNRQAFRVLQARMSEAGLIVETVFVGWREQEDDALTAAEHPPHRPDQFIGRQL